MSNIEKEENRKIQFEKALDFDMLSSLAWFNLGVLYIELSDFNKATFCFTMASIIQPYDIGAWVNATLCCFSVKSEITILYLIINTAYSKNKENYLELLFLQMEKQIEKSKTNELMELLHEKLISKDNFDSKPTIRVLNENNRFQDILKNN